jgi:hypothetical protein
VSDVVQDQPSDAAAALAALPPPQVYEAAADTAALDPKERLKQRLGGPIPFAVYAAMFGAGIGGALLGALYGAFVLGTQVPVLIVVCMLVAEAWAAARLGAKRQLRALTTYQRGRIATLYTVCVTLPLVALTLWLGVNKLPMSILDRVEHLSSGGVALALLSVLVLLAAVGLLRYLLLSLFAPRAATARAHPVGNAS